MDKHKPSDEMIKDLNNLLLTGCGFEKQNENVTYRLNPPRCRFSERSTLGRQRRYLYIQGVFFFWPSSKKLEYKISL